MTCVRWWIFRKIGTSFYGNVLSVARWVELVDQIYQIIYFPWRDNDIHNYTYANTIWNHPWKCIGRESNPGRPRGRRAFHHWTTDAVSQGARLAGTVYFAIHGTGGLMRPPRVWLLCELDLWFKDQRVMLVTRRSRWHPSLRSWVNRWPLRSGQRPKNGQSVISPITSSLGKLEPRFT